MFSSYCSIGHNKIIEAKRAVSWLDFYELIFSALKKKFSVFTFLNFQDMYDKIVAVKLKYFQAH